MQYVVLQPISPPSGPIIHPAPEPRPGEDAPPPVLIDATLISGETDEERAANTARLIARGVIAALPEPVPALARRTRTQE